MEAQSGFPNENIDPRKKTGKAGMQFCLDFARAAWADSRLGKYMFYQYAREYDIIKSYAHGKQDTTKYRKPMHLSDKTDDTWIVIDPKIIAIPKKHRQIALGRLQKSEYDVIATPVDALARDDADKYFAQMMAKIMLRQQMQKQNPQLAQAPVLQAQGGEPLDLEELELQKEYGFKHDYAIAAEEGIDLILNNNGITRCRRQVIEDLFDYGVAVYKDWMEPDGKIRFRRCDPRSIITNYCRYPDFSDIRYCGEVLEMTWQDFREKASGQFTEQEFSEIYEASKRQTNVDNNYTTYPRINDTYKVRVLDLEFFSDDEYVYEDKQTDYGNQLFGKTEYSQKGKPGTVVKKRKNVYRAKWVIGTQYVYDYGLAYFMKRNGVTNTKLSYHIEATNFHEMRATGIMEDIIPIADQIMISWLKMQVIRTELKPYYIDIDLDGIEDVALAKGGEQLSPKQLLEMWSQNGILLTRRRDLTNNNVNYKTIEYVETNYGEALQAAWNDFRNHIQLLSEATGFNEMTDGSTPNPKTQNPATEAAVESTNNALYHIAAAEENLLLSLADAVLCRLKRAVKMGKVAGYVPALGNTIKYIEVSPDIDDHDYGLILENKIPMEQKQFLQQEMSKYAMDGTLQPVDMLVIENCRNLKQAEKILAMRVNRRRQENQQMALQNQQMTIQGQIQSAQAAEQAKQQTLALQSQLKIQEINVSKEWDFRIKQLDVMGKVKANQDTIASNEKINDAEEAGEPPIEQTPIPQEQQEQPQQPLAQ